MRIYGERSTPIGNDQSGRYQFTNTYTRQNSSSGTDYQGLQAYAAFLLGMPSTTTWQKQPDSTTSTPRPGASSCRTTGGSRAS